MAGNTTNVRLVGPTVEGLAPAILDGLIAGAVKEVADYARYDVLITLDKVLQHPTGYYESQIVAQPIDPFNYSVNDSMVIYGPWLEGVGSRNYPVTRFKGYHTFRIVQGRISQQQRAITAAWLDRASGVL